MRYFQLRDADGQIINICSGEKCPTGYEEISRTTWMMLRIILRVEIQEESVDNIAENETWWEQPMI